MLNLTAAQDTKKHYVDKCLNDNLVNASKSQELTKRKSDIDRMSRMMSSVVSKLWLVCRRV